MAAFRAYCMNIIDDESCGWNKKYEVYPKIEICPKCGAPVIEVRDITHGEDYV